MQKNVIMKAIILIGSLTLTVLATSCSNNSTTETKSDSTNTTNASATVPDNDAYAGVPQTARASFETKYPKATNVKWTKYSPDANTKVEASDWNYKLDTSDYVVTFNWDGYDYTAWYDDSVWIRSTARIDNAKLPAAVNDAINAQFAGYTVSEVDKENDKDQTRYEVDLTKGSEKMKVTFTEDGKVVKKKGPDGKAKEDTK